MQAFALVDSVAETKPLTKKNESIDNNSAVLDEILYAVQHNRKAREEMLSVEEILMEAARMVNKNNICLDRMFFPKDERKNDQKFAVDQSPPKYVKSRQLTATEVTNMMAMSSLGRIVHEESAEKMLEEQAKIVVGYRFQQAINCCQITATAYSFTCLGYPTTVDDIFLAVGVNVESAVGDGMTLAETHELAVRYINIKKLPIFVDCYHLDEGVASVEDLGCAFLSEGVCGIGDILSLNFHSGIAHGKKRGGGHFSILAGYSPKFQTVVVADVHPMKYGAFWSTPLKQMYAAMTDKDSVGRSRGMLHFGLLNSKAMRPLPGLERARSLLDWSSPTGHSKDVLLQYIPVRWGSMMGCRNMGGVSALALAIKSLEGPQCLVPELDDIMRALKESYTEHLNTFLNASKIVDMVTRLKELDLTELNVSSLKLRKDLRGENLRSALNEVNCEKDSVTVLVSFNMNQAQNLGLVKEDLSEAGALCHGAKTWAVLASFSRRAQVDDRAGVVMATPYNSEMYGRLWTCSLLNLAKGIAAVGSDSLVVLSSKTAVLSVKVLD